jgi:hypothetical protein
MALTITIPGAVETTTGSTAPAVLTVGVGSPGVGVPSGGSTGQYLVKASATSYDTTWLTLPANYITSVTAPLAVTAGNLAVNLSAYLTTATAASTYQTIAGMSSYLTSATAASTYAVIAAGQPTSGTVGQVLTKASGTNYDSYWATPVIGDKYYTTSTTSLAIGTGTKSLTVGTGLSYTTQQTVIVAYDAANHMHATVTSYNSSTGAMVISVSQKSGSGTYSSWTVNVGGVVSGSWGSITGTLSDQTDLQAALDLKANLASPSLTGTPLSTTASVSTNTTQIATTAFVLGQVGTATPIVNGTAAVGTSLLYSRQDHVHPIDTTRAALASPTFTGTPTLPTGTIATTQTAGNNTTALATTAFVTAAVPAFATLTNVIGTPSSTTLALNPSLAPWMMANANVRYFGMLGFTSTSGGGTSNYGPLREVYTTAASQRATYLDSSYGFSTYGLKSSTDAANINFSKKYWLFGIYFPSGGNTGTDYYGDSNTTSRINLGGRSANAAGALTQKGIGIFKAGGTGSLIYLTVHNGTTLTSVSSGVTNATGQSFKYVIYSDGTGNVTLYLDGVSVATTSAGPTGMTVSGYSIYEEQVETSATFSVRQGMLVTGAGLIIER